MLDEIKETLKIASEEPKRYDETRQQWIDTSSQKVDDVVTGGLEKINMPGAEFIGDRARNITGFAQDMTIPESWELPLLAGGAAVAAAEPTPFGEALVGLKYGTGVTSRAYRAGKKVLKKPIAVGTAMAANIVDDAFSRANSLFNRNNSNWRLSTPDGDLRPDFTSPVDPNARIENLGGRGFKEKSELIRDGSQTTRMEKAFDENKKLIGKENIDNTIGAKKQLSEIDKFAKVTKSKLRKYVEQYGGSEADLEEIFKEYSTKHTSALNAKAWLNQYWKDLNEGVGIGGLKNARLKIVDGKLKIVGGSTKHSIAHPFELDHSKAKELMHELGFEGADMSDNLDIVYTEWNRAKNNIGNPAIPDDILEAIGQSTTLENFVRRRLDETFMLSGERVPQRFKEAAKTRMMDNALDMKPGEKLSDIVEIELKFWDEYSNLLVQIDDYVPAKVQRQLDAQTNLTPQEYLQQLKDMGVYDNLTRTLKNKYERLSQQWIERSRGYGANEASKRARFYGDRSDG